MLRKVRKVVGISDNACLLQSLKVPLFLVEVELRGFFSTRNQKKLVFPHTAF